MFQQGAFLIDPNETPQSIAKKRALIQQMIMPYGKANNIGEGIAQLFNGIGTGAQLRALNKAESAGQASGATAAENIGRMLQGNAPLGNGPFPEAPKQPQSSAAPISATGVDVAKRLQSDFGLSPAAAAGFAGNLAHESGNFKTLQEINPTVKGSRGGFGWAQWTGPRRRAYESWASQNGLDPASPEANYGFLKHELTNTPESAVIKALQGVNDPAQAAQIVSDKFLRPGIPHMNSRVSKSQQIANMLMGKGNGDPSMASTMPFKPFTGDTSGMVSNSPSPIFKGDVSGMVNPASQGVQVASLDPSIGNPQANPVQQPQLPPATQPVQMAQAAPQATQQPAMGIQDAGTPFEQQAPQGQGIDIGALLKQANNPFLDDNSRAFVNGLIQQEMQKRDPAYQQKQQMQTLEMQKAQLELQQMQNPQPRLENVGGRLVQINPDGSVKEAYAPPPEPVKEPAKPAGIVEYEYAKQQGFPGTFQDWEASKKGGMSIQTNPDGTMTFQQGSNIKPLTEGQSKDVVYSTRAKGALKTLNPIAGELTSRAAVASEYIPFGFGSGVQSDNFQIARTAGDEFLQAILRKDTGAAITTDEQTLYGGTYLPQPGDSEARLKYKEEARNRAVAAIDAGMSPAAIVAQEKALAKNLKLDEQDAQPDTAPRSPNQVPQGIDPAIWEFMSPEDRALWN